MRPITLCLGLLALLAGAPAPAAPLAVICVRDMADDPPDIRALFALVDRMAVRELSDARAQFFLADRGFSPIDEFVLRSNYHDGREDSAPLEVTAIRRLQFDGQRQSNLSYVVATKRSAWFDRRSDTQNSYTEIHEFWLVHFSNCRIDSVREAPELWYLLEGSG